MAKGWHQNQNDLDGRILLFSQMTVRGILVPYQRTEPLKVLSPGYKQQWFLGVFLEDNVPGVFGWNYARTNGRQGQSDQGKLPLAERLELQAKGEMLHRDRPSVGFFFQPKPYMLCFHGTVFVFIIKCQLVLIKAPVMSKPWVIPAVVMTAMAPFVLPRPLSLSFTLSGFAVSLLSLGVGGGWGQCWF